MTEAADTGWMTQVKKGLLDLCILNLLSREALYGYQIVKHLTAAPGLVVTEGTVYPLLYRLKKDGLLKTTLEESSLGPVRRNYELSALGRRRLAELNLGWRRIQKAVDGFVSPESQGERG